MTPPGMIKKWYRGERALLVAGGAAGFLLFWWRFGLGIVHPARSDWLLGSADTGFHQLGWMFFRAEAWHWPPGAITTYMAPYGTTIGLTDSLPLLALPFKAMSFLLPADFQYAGLWLLACHVLMGVFGLRLSGIFFRSLVPRILGAGLLVLYPVFLLRDGHIALTALWVLPAALWLYLKPAPDPGRAPVYPWLVLVATVALIHPYPAVMVFAFLLADQARRLWLTRETTTASALVTVAGSAALLVLLWYLAGFFRPGQLPVGTLPADVGYAADLNAVVNSQGRAALLPGLPQGAGDPFEGFNYFGAGGLLALLAAVALGGGRRLAARAVGHWTLVAVLAVAALFACGLLPGAGEQQFRAQARFLWPLYYCLVAAGLAAVARRPRIALLLTALLLVVQVVDVAPLLDRKPEYAALGFTSRLQDPQWRRALAQADLLLVSPSSTATTVFADDFVDLALKAHEAGVPTTAGFAARSYRENIAAADRLTRDYLFGGRPDPSTVAVLRRSHFAEMFPSFAAVLRCTDLDGFPVCFAREGGFLPEQEYRIEPVALDAFLADHLAKTLILVGRGDARGVLTVAGAQRLAGLGSRIRQLPAGASYVGIFVHGDLVFERMQPSTAIEATGAKNTPLGAVMMKKQLEITASGTGSGEYASLTVDGREVLFNREGLNIAVLDDRQEVVAVATFCPPQSFSGLAEAPAGLVFRLVTAAGN